YWRYRLGALPREAWEVLFPRPYWSLIEREARRQGIDPLLVAALIRQESRFERDAVSSAGALGLMQLMPPTARHLARSRRLSRERILEPELNVRLGTRFLAELLEQFQGRVEMAVAAYNAGGRRVKEWEARDDYREMAEFVEDIPVTQTREFVYIVLRNYRFYRDLYGEPERRTAQE
ncbi:MAG: lytic transglycosylase domain-containing protein, partial [Candidatus Acidoferrales bacterium]